MIFPNMEDFQSNIQSQTFDQDLMGLSQTIFELQPLGFEKFQRSWVSKSIWINRFQQPFANSYQSSFADERDDIDVIGLIADVKGGIGNPAKSHSDFFHEYLDDSTNTRDINAANIAFEKMLNQRTPAFLWSILHIDFEDGMSNSAIEEVEYYLQENEYVTILWLHTIFSQNQLNQNVLAALLRIIAMTIKSEKSDKLMTMVIAGLNQPSSKTQEAALEVIEEWRTEQCLSALHNLQFHSCWIEKYAMIVKKELEEELHVGKNAI